MPHHHLNLGEVSPSASLPLPWGKLYPSPLLPAPGRGRLSGGVQCDVSLTLLPGSVIFGVTGWQPHSYKVLGNVQDMEATRILMGSSLVFFYF